MRQYNCHDIFQENMVAKSILFTELFLVILAVSLQ